MKVDITDIGSTRKKMTVEIPREEVSKVAEEIYRNLSRNAVVKGFRRGKAPRSLLKTYYGGYIKEEMAAKLVREKFDELARENNLFVVSMPEFENAEPKEGEDFVFSATFDVKPEVEPSVYTGFELTRPKVSVDEKDVDEVIERLRQTYADVKEVDDPEYCSVEGDYVVLDITCDEDESLNRSRMTVEAGGRSVFPGLEKAVVGMKTGESKEVDVTFGDDHFLEARRGTTARLRIQVLAIRNRILPVLDDSFAAMVHKGATSVEGLRDAIRDDLKARLDAEVRSVLEKQVTEKLLEANAFEVPESMIRLQAIMMLHGMSQRLAAQGVKLKDVYPDADSLREESMASAERLVRTSLLVEAIAKKAGIEVTDEDVEKDIARIAEKYSVGSDEVRKNFEEQDRMGELKYEILERKVFDYIIANSTVVEVESLAQEGTTR